MRVALLWAGGIGDGGATGLAPHVEELAATLRAYGHDAHVVSATAALRSTDRECNGIPVHEVRVERRLAANSDSCKATSYYLDCLQQTGGAFSTLVAYHRGFLPALGEMKRKSGARTVMWLHTDAGLHRRDAGQHYCSRAWSYTEAVDRFFVTSAALRERIVARGVMPEERIEVLYPGVDLDRLSRWVDQGKVKLQWKVGPFDPLVLFVGEMAHPQGPDLLLEAAFDIVQAHPQARFIFVGDGPLRPFLQVRARVLGLQGLIHFVGAISSEQLGALYNACDVVCIPHRSGHESQGVLEAWSAGKPVVITRAALPEYFDPELDGLVVRATADSIEEAICRLLADRGLANSLGAHAWHRVDGQFSWRTIASRMLGVDMTKQRRKAS